MTAEAYRQVIAAPARDRRDLFLTAANRLGTPIGNVEKDFWVSWALHALYQRLPPNGPRLLFKGGTSLSKAHGLIARFSEDIDITIFRDDINEPATVEELQALSNNRRRRRLDGIRDACRAYIAGPMRNQLAAVFAEDTAGAGRIELDADDPDGQTLLLWYPEIDPQTGAYVRPAVRIEGGAKSAIDPHRGMTIKPYIAEDIPDLDLAVDDVTTIEAERTLWDKVVIVHGLRRWFERRGVLRQDGHRVSRHYYDLHCLAQSDHGRAALAHDALAIDCVQHARMFFDRPDYDLATAIRGSFAVAPSREMLDALRRDYAATIQMIFGAVPSFDEIMESVIALDALVNGARQ
jgi:hypothetical protein